MRIASVIILSSLVYMVSCESAEESSPEIKELSPEYILPRGEAGDYGMDINRIESRVQEMKMENEDRAWVQRAEYNKVHDTVMEDLQVSGAIVDEDKTLHQLSVNYSSSNSWNKRYEVFFDGDAPLYVEELMSSADSNWNQYLYKYYYQDGKLFAALWNTVDEGGNLGEEWNTLSEVTPPDVALFVEAFNAMGRFQMEFSKKLDAKNAIYLQFDNPESGFQLTLRVDNPDDFTTTLMEGGDRYKGKKVILEVVRFTDNNFTYNRYVSGGFLKEQ